LNQIHNVILNTDIRTY